MTHLAISLLLVIIGIGILFEPCIGIIAYYAFDIIRPQNLFWWAFAGSRFSFLIAVLTIISLLFRISKHKGRHFNWPVQHTLIIGFLVTIFLSFWFSSYKDVSLLSFLRISKMLLLYLIASYLLDSKRNIRWLIWGLVVPIGYLAIKGNWYYLLFGMPQITSTTFGYNSPLDNNGYAMIFVMALPLVYFLIFSEKKSIIKILLIILFPLLIHAIILTYSRGGFLGLCVVCVFCLLRTKKKLAIGIAGILLIALIVRLAGPPVIERLSTIKNYEQDSSAAERLESWKAGLRMIASHPLSGVGLDNYRYLSMEYNPDGLSNAIVAHNTFIHTGAEAGIPALLLYLALLFSCFKDLRRIRIKFHSDKENWKYYYASMLESSLLGYIVCGIFLTLSWFELFYPMIALTVALKRVTYESEIKAAVKKPNKAYKLSGNLEPIKV